MTIRHTALAALTALALTAGCAPGYDQYGRGVGGLGVGIKQGVGTLGGAALGGLGGAQLGKGNGKLAFTALGALLGAVAGGAAGSSMDKADEVYAAQAEQRAVTMGRRATWQSESNPHIRGYAEPIQDYRGDYGERCRKYRHTIFVEDDRGREKKATEVGRACQSPDGTWRIVSE